MEGKNVGTKTGKVPKQGLTGTKNLTIMVPEGREHSYHSLTEKKTTYKAPTEKAL